MGFDISRIAYFPTDPGVYLMKDSLGTILYIGKAKNLQRRLRNYFSGGDGREMIPHLVARIEEIETLVVTSEKEALLLENNLIKKHQPKYNALLKDDKSYIALTINPKEKWPKISIVRYRGDCEEKGVYFGPYTSATAARETLDLILRLFPLRQCSDAEFVKRTRPCILYQMKRCLAPCVNKCTAKEYEGCVTQTIQFLKGQDKEVVNTLIAEMEKASAALEFEKAAKILNTLRQIQKTQDLQYVDRPQGVDADAIGLYREGNHVVLFQLLFRKGRLSGSRAFDFKDIMGDDEELISTFLLQHYDVPFSPPREILLAQTLSEASVIAEIISSRATHKVALQVPVRGEKKILVDMALKNAEAHFKAHIGHRIKKEEILLEMQEALGLSHFPHKIECFDNSHYAGKETVAVVVTFIDGMKESRGYRTFHLKMDDRIDDYAAMKEVLTRRYQRAKEENALPDLVIVDGGKGQLNVALKVFETLNIIGVDVIGLAKEEGRHDKGMTGELVFLPGKNEPIHFKKNSPTLFLLQNIRDEAHRFAIAFHRKKRSKVLIKSVLDDVKGIGPVKKKALLECFGSVKGIIQATESELLSVKGITQKDVDALKKHLKM